MENVEDNVRSQDEITKLKSAEAELQHLKKLLLAKETELANYKKIMRSDNCKCKLLSSSSRKSYLT